MRLLLALALALLAAPASAQDVWQQDGEAAPADRSRAARDGFGAMLLTTNDREGFLRAWDGPTPPHLDISDRATRGAPIAAMLLFYGCRAGADGNCNVTAEFTILQPGGQVYGEPFSGEAWRGAPGPDGAIRLSTTNISLIVEPQDPMGIWTIRIRITDHVRGLVLEVEREVTVDTPPTAVTA